MIPIMSDKWIPLDRRPITVPPTRQQVEVARDLCFQLLDKMFGQFWHCGIMADSYENARADAEKYNNVAVILPFWAMTAADEFKAIQMLNDEANEGVRRWAFFFDRFPGDVQMVGSRTYSNTPLAIVGMVGEFMGRADDARAVLAEMDAKQVPTVEVVATLARLARDIWNAGIGVVGTDFHAAYSHLQARLRVEMAKAADAAQQLALPTPTAVEPVLSYEEQQIIDALRKNGRRMTQLQLLAAAGLGEHGTLKALLSQMRQRRLIDNDRDNWGKGYGLPEWMSTKA